ncbi:S-adenosyl-L-methionine-dependent methyltransferase [Dichomitus squalens LYAD-421 SS1]|uniref:S-adenosyl-L-methionine-dependent methyltransferase n=1 Tax=Dichomitus squalens (strain LYAD-421) TaxID=732165 RepID=UPI00044155EE|nr:S-adenosyl-L-methionine-dependent methyltransferase [Dichomitus squalens LYAD-421 SS1]EJF67225.1 S-adenosyl-L-methionine-dependent methyltransferase [Dichomitus squalens LYAD-421 SS1]
MPHHPFSPEDAPYMQAYSQILLENDYQTHRLLCKLARADTPTFHNFGKKPPSDVLDLGCGEGFWVLHAAKLWKSSNTRIVGLDLIDVHNNEAGEVHPHLEPEHAAKNVVWKRANFVKYPLPFPDNSFDLVRMANLTLCIPVSRWKFVLTQVRRVLRPGGRLELIDDDLFFPTILPRPTRDDPRSLSRPNYQRAANSENIVLGLSSPISRARSEKPLPKLPSFERSPNFKNGHARTSSEVDFSANSIIATHLETIFQNMLTNRYGIAPRPHTFLEHMLREVFGLSCAHQTHHFELAVPSRDLVEQCENFEPSPRPRVSSHAKRLSEDEKRGKGSPWTRTSPSSPVLASSPLSGTRSQRTSDEHPRVDPAMLHTATPKARQLLLGDGSSLDSRTPSWKEAGPYQPPGLVLLPATLIPCTPLELEMHACKHMNTLLGCKDALSKYVTAQKGRHGKPVVSERELDDYLWDYECFRRKRFNWPQDVPGLQLEDDFDESVAPSPPATKTIFKFSAGTPPQAKRTVSIDGLRAHVYGGATASTASKEHSTHVRTIRVYEATKSMHPGECGYGDH